MCIRISAELTPGSSLGECAILHCKGLMATSGLFRPGVASGAALPQGSVQDQSLVPAVGLLSPRAPHGLSWAVWVPGLQYRYIGLVCLAEEESWC